MTHPSLRTSIVALVATGLLAAGCSTVNPYFDPSKMHHRPDGFNNNYSDNWRTDQPSFFDWQRARWTSPLAPQNPARVKTAPTDVAYLHANRKDVTVTWIGHATVLWQVGGLNILTDPHFGQRASPLSFVGPHREVPLPIAVADLPHIDAVLISHNHYDHLDASTVRALNQQAGGPPLFIVPLGVDIWMKEEQIAKVQKMDWWDRIEVKTSHGSVSVRFVPAQHWSSRTPWDRNASLWGGFVVQTQFEGAPYSMYYSGDTGYSKDFADIGVRFEGFDFSQIPVGCYEPRWFMQDQHVNEDEAVKIHRDVKSRQSMGIHWGSFRLCDEPIDAPIDRLPIARKKFGIDEAAFFLPKLGETRVLRKAAVAP